MSGSVEQALDALVPGSWSEDDLSALLGNTTFKRDRDALTRSLNEPIRELVFRGGKRLRPKLFLTILEGLGVDPGLYVDIAAAIELIHNGTLVVDDVEDSSDTRRGKPSLHEMFGIDVAINAGNAMYFLPVKVITNHNRLTDTQRLRLLDIYADEMVNVHMGQATDIDWHKRIPANITEDMYMEMCRLKTGCLMRMSVRFACAVASQNVEVENSFKVFAERAGVAFQIQDDVLDLTADAQAFGKPYGHDIQEGKISLLIIYALEMLSKDDGERLLEILRLHTEERVVIDEGRDLILKTDAVRKASDKAQGLFESGWAAIERVDINDEGKSRLQELAESFVKRSV